MAVSNELLRAVAERNLAAAYAEVRTYQYVWTVALPSSFECGDYEFPLDWGDSESRNPFTRMTVRTAIDKAEQEFDHLLKIATAAPMVEALPADFTERPDFLRVTLRFLACPRPDLGPPELWPDTFGWARP